MIRFLLPELLEEKKRAENRRITWKEVAEATGISSQVLTNMCSPLRQAVTNTAFIEALCRYFQCEVGDLIKFEPPITLGNSVNVDELYPDRRRR